MNGAVVPTLKKWPFFLADLAMLGLAGYLVHQVSGSVGLWQASLALLATLAGGCFCALPYLREYSAAVKFSEADALASTVAQMGSLEQVKTAIIDATGRWESIQEHSTRTVEAAKEITERMQAELKEFCAFLQKAHSTEHSHLRLEVEKLRRGHSEWLQVTTHMLDHVFALHKAASRSGNAGLVAQLNQFQFACRDAARRVGLSPFAPALAEPFNAEAHQLQDSAAKATPGLPITDVVAPGYTYQGQLLRRALVAVGTGSTAPDKASTETPLPAVPPGGREEFPV